MQSITDQMTTLYVLIDDCDGAQSNHDMAEPATNQSRANCYGTANNAPNPAGTCVLSPPGFAGRALGAPANLAG